MEGQDQPQDIGAVVNAVNIDFGFIRGGMLDVGRLEVIFPVLVAQFKLRQFILLKIFFRAVEFILGFKESRALVAATLIDSDQGLDFPAV